MTNSIKNLENNVLNDITTSALKGLVVCGVRADDATLHFTTYRNSTLELATYLKLSPLFKADNPVDCHVVDRIEDEFRFTVIYNIQSFKGNVRFQIVTKTNDLLPLMSLQSVYPAFNWAEREM
jgi:NADH:ubiquinone oxidoreductase subunit C